MKTLSLQITYRRGEPFAAYIYLGKQVGRNSTRTREIDPDLLVDFAADGTPIGIEIVSPRYVTIERVEQVFDQLGLGRPEPRELAPLRAA